MASFDVVDLGGKKVGAIDLDDGVFAAPVREHLLWEVVKAQLASRRSGTASTKTRGEVRGSTKKIHRQKGTGRARHSGIRAPTFAGGGETFGPRPRDYSYRPPRKVRRSALVSAVSLRARDRDLVILRDFKLGEVKTKKLHAILVKLDAAKSLIVDDPGNVNLVKSARNLRSAKFVAPEGLNVYDVLRYQKLLLTGPAAKRIEQALRADGAPKAVGS
jgi:large subunit ribosomal protein L4